MCGLFLLSVLLVLVEISRTSRDFAELSGRSQPVVGDVVVALINLGISLDDISTYGKREHRPIIPPPQQISAQKQINLLQAGSKLSHPPHIPHHLPALPDPHAYIRTPVRHFAHTTRMRSDARDIWLSIFVDAQTAGHRIRSDPRESGQSETRH